LQYSTASTACTAGGSSKYRLGVEVLKNKRARAERENVIYYLPQYVKVTFLKTQK
jgi:hypothetical protein